MTGNAALSPARPSASPSAGPAAERATDAAGAPAPEAPPLVDLVVEDAAWHDALPDLDSVAETAARLALDAAGLDPAGREIALLACSDARIATLNADHRGRPVPTNVLSWPRWDLAPAAPGATPPPPPDPGHGAPTGEPTGDPTDTGADPDAPLAGATDPLGDVAIALETCTAEAKAAGLGLKEHATHLILHGCLHLLGYDHTTEADAIVMEGLETRALKRIGIDDPYERGDAGPTRRT